MGIQIKGLKNLQVKMAGLSKEDIESTLERAALMVETDAKDNCPESGMAGIQGFGGSSLKDSITHEVENNEAAIGTNKDYAMYVHQGTGLYAINGDGRQTPWTYFNDYIDQFVTTHGQEAHPFLTDSLDKNSNDIKALFVEKIKDKL